MRHPVRHRILDNRLQQKRRDEAIVRAAGIDRQLQSITIAYALHLEVPLCESELARKRDPLRRTEVETLAEEFGEQQAHATGTGRVRRRQRADRVQAVEEKVRVDLRPQRPQLGVAREHLPLECAPFGLAGVLGRRDDVTHRQGQEVDELAEAE